ncbi:hypothetical protein Hanom_Chr00s000001g01594751 [Helianthus anomalus]
MRLFSSNAIFPNAFTSAAMLFLLTHLPRRFWCWKGTPLTMLSKILKTLFYYQEG